MQLLRHSLGGYVSFYGRESLGRDEVEIMMAERIILIQVEMRRAPEESEKP